VQNALQIIQDANLFHEYLPIVGLRDFIDHSLELAYGKSKALKEKRIAAIQTLSGTGECEMVRINRGDEMLTGETGALRVAGEFLAEHLKGSKVYLPNPTWSNHRGVFERSGVQLGQYRYYNDETKGLDFEGDWVVACVLRVVQLKVSM